MGFEAGMCYLAVEMGSYVVGGGVCVCVCVCRWLVVVVVVVAHR